MILQTIALERVHLGKLLQWFLVALTFSALALQFSFHSRRNDEIFPEELVINGDLSIVELDKNKITKQTEITAEVHFVVILLGNKTFETNDLFVPMSSGFCQYVKQAQDDMLASTNKASEMMFHIKLNCRDQFYRSTAGTGNWLVFYYGMRKVALAQGNTSILFECTDLHDEYRMLKEFVLPWLNGYFPKSSDHNFTLQDVCDPSYDQFDMTSMIPILKFELQRMALGIVGDHTNDRYRNLEIAPSTPIRNSKFGTINGAMYNVSCDPKNPLLSNVQLDDVIIHFRCGDIISAHLNGFGFYKYDYYSRYISPEARTVGIITQPFRVYNAFQTRDEDNIDENGKGCETIVIGLVAYIKEQHPNIEKIAIHNGASETVALAVARMLMANQTIASASSFSMISSLATFGTSYIPINRNDWLANSLFHGSNDWKQNYANINIVWPGPYIASYRFGPAWKNNQSEIMEWFKNTNMELSISEYSFRQ